MKRRHQNPSRSCSDVNKVGVAKAMFRKCELNMKGHIEINGEMLSYTMQIILSRTALNCGSVAGKTYGFSPLGLLGEPSVMKSLHDRVLFVTLRLRRPS